MVSRFKQALKKRDPIVVPDEAAEFIRSGRVEDSAMGVSVAAREEVTIILSEPLAVKADPVIVQADPVVSIVASPEDMAPDTVITPQAEKSVDVQPTDFLPPSIMTTSAQPVLGDVQELPPLKGEGSARVSRVVKPSVAQPTAVERQRNPGRPPVEDKGVPLSTLISEPIRQRIVRMQMEHKMQRGDFDTVRAIAEAAFDAFLARHGY
jgi:hypothetical protein